MTKLLPNNSTQLEKDIVESIDYVVANKDILIKKTWNPDECPSEFLVYLAYFVGVDFDIYNDLTEPQKREYIKNSIEIYRHKGTLGALKSALAITGYTISIIEWYEDNSTPHTAKIRIQSASGSSIDIALAQKIIRKTKNVQTIISVTQVYESMADKFVGVVPKLKIKYIASNFTTSPVYKGNLYIGACLQMKLIHK